MARVPRGLLYPIPASGRDHWQARAEAAEAEVQRLSAKLAARSVVHADRNELLTEDWVRDQGFKWTQGERQTHKHWKLLLGWADGSGNACFEDLGIEISMSWWWNGRGEVVGDPEAWNCWLFGMNRSFLHVRVIKTRRDLLDLIEALTGQPWDRSLSRYGNLYHEKHRSWLVKDDARVQRAGDAAGGVAGPAESTP